MLTSKDLQKYADECLRLARESKEASLTLIEMGTEFRVMAQHLDTRPPLPFHPTRIKVPDTKGIWV